VRLVFARPARDDLVDIVRHIAAENPNAALAVRDEILATALRLRRFPRSGRLGRQEGTRELTVPGTPYLLVDTISDDRVNIAAVLHGARDIPNMLDTRTTEEEP
jgi:toxin ParE1/3/4